MSAAFRSVAFEQREFIDQECVARQPGMGGDEVLRIATSTAEACHGDVRQIGAIIGWEACPDAGPVDLAVKLFEGIVGLHSRPETTDPTLALKLSQTG